jgi:hypothetical protein
LAGLEDPLFGIMMRSDRVDNRASLGILRGARAHVCLRQKRTWRSTHDLTKVEDSAARWQKPSRVLKVGDCSDVGLRTAGDGASGDVWRLAGTQAAVVDKPVTRAR